MAFGFSEPGVPVIPLAVMWQNVTAGGTGTTMSGTLSSASINITSLAATNGLTPGMTVSGTGITPGSTIATIVSSTAITLNQPTISGTTGAQTLTFGLSDPEQSVWAGGSTSIFPSPPLANILTDTPDCPFNIPDAQVLLIGANYVPAPGRGLVTIPTATGAIQYNINGSWVSVFVAAANVTCMYIMADGVNVRFLATAAGTFTFYRERSSKSTSI
jgi:hypothetical protein